MVAAVLTRIFHAAAPNLMKDGDPIRERPLMTSNFRVGRGVQNDPQNQTYRLKIVGKGRGQKSSKIIGSHLWMFPS